MQNAPTPAAPICNEPVLACNVCLKEIPHSAAKSHEAAEYVYYFCGDACFAQWEADAVAEMPELANPAINRR